MCSGLSWAKSNAIPMVAVVIIKVTVPSDKILVSIRVCPAAHKAKSSLEEFANASAAFSTVRLLP